MLAKIILKTGWNLAPLLNMDVDDILRADMPAGTTSPYLIRMQKARAGYTTQFYEIEGETVAMASGKQVTTVVRELLAVRDAIRVEILTSRRCTVTTLPALFLSTDKEGDVVRLSSVQFRLVINRLLRQAGCPVSFSASRIRKSGLNDIYLREEKQFSTYQTVSAHSESVFKKHYQYHDPDTAERTLTRAVEVMASHFRGEPVSDDIKIVTEPESTWQEVPNGGCAVSVNDEKSQQYSRGKTAPSKCGAFSACLWCEHYRLIASDDHVWRLISYRESVIADMRQGITIPSHDTGQADYIEALTQRVDILINTLNTLSPGVRDAGTKLYEEKGLHPLWYMFRPGANHG